MNPQVVGRAVGSDEAWATYRAWYDVPGVTFLPEPERIEHHLEELCRAGGFAFRHLTDAYLGAYARAAGCRIVAFDNDFSRFQGVDFLHLTA
jgi:predicted nucleic acid-binding protein